MMIGFCSETMSGLRVLAKAGTQLLGMRQPAQKKEKEKQIRFHVNVRHSTGKT